jgi:4-diphosphocytidyl-2-C-methyl-D-erythritol kinase
MYLRRDHFKRTARAPAKLNLFLEVLGRREDGFHELETLMVTIRLGDWLAMSPLPTDDGGGPGEITLGVRIGSPVGASQQSFQVPSDGENLIVRAVELLRQRSGCALGARIELLKRIPVAAGLGGGSSDAAAALRLANRVWQLGWSRERLAELSAELGSDVPFFLHSGAAICRGRGERVERLAGVRPLDFVIVLPPEPLGTAEVYRAHDELNQRHSPAIESGRVNQIARLIGGKGRLELGRWMHNRLEAAAASLSGWVDRLRDAFSKLGFVAHQLSGSGSAYFGIARHARHARRLASLLKTRQLGQVYVTRSCT